jgi:hypothetical protein
MEIEVDYESGREILLMLHTPTVSNLLRSAYFSVLQKRIGFFTL